MLRMVLTLVIGHCDISSDCPYGEASDELPPCEKSWNGEELGLSSEYCRVVRTLTVLDCGRVVVNATMLRRIGGLLREQDRRDDRHTEDVHILCIDVIASDMLTSRLCSKLALA